MKGMSLTMQIVIVVIILLVAAMVVLSVFGVQMEGISKTVGEWISGVPSSPGAVDCPSKATKDACSVLYCRKCCTAGTTTFAKCTGAASPCPSPTVNC